MRLVGIRLNNFGRFRGEQELDLGPGIFAIVATSVDDPRRSNWLGKSTLLDAVRWAVFGELSSWETLDAAISRGEREMAVDVELSDGTFICREKVRGKSASLRVVVPDPTTESGERSLVDAEAQAELQRRVGLSFDDFEATVWVGQKSANRIVVARPAERTEMVADWLALDPLVSAAERVSTSITSAERRLDIARSDLARFESETRVDRQSLVSELESARELLASGESHAEEEKQARILHDRWELLSRSKSKLVAATSEIAAIEATAPTGVPSASAVAEARDLLTSLRESAAAASRETVRLERLVAGEFDGRCPVTCSACPVADTVRALGEENSQARDAARAREQAIGEKLHEVRTTYNNLSSRSTVWDQYRRKLDAATAAAAALEQSYVDPGPEPPIVPPAPSIVSLAGRVKDVEHAIAKYDLAVSGAENARRTIAQLGVEIEHRRVALRILGRGGAQRQIALRALSGIEETANRMLAGVGIDLSVRLVYGKELQGAAEICGCGAAFPKSTTVRECSRCGAARGKRRDEKLYVELSDRSGAADDLAGVAIQLAASRWLRAARSAPWSVVALDEPFGALDAANRPALARALSTMVREGFEQAFVVAHSPDILEALPNRILVTSDGDWSRVEVIRG